MPDVVEIRTSMKKLFEESHHKYECCINIARVTLNYKFEQHYVAVFMCEIPVNFDSMTTYRTPIPNRKSYTQIF